MNPSFWKNRRLTVLRVIAFDLDDTLYPEWSYVLSGFRAVAAWVETAWGIPMQETYRELEADFWAGTRGDTFNRWLKAHGPPAEDALGKMIEIYRTHQPRLEPYPDVLPVLRSMRERYSLALITEGYLEVHERKLLSLGIRDRFDFIHIGSEDQRELWKPSPYPFENLCAHFSIQPEHGVYVGDNPAKDFYGARSVGLKTIRLRREDGLHANLAPEDERYRADRTVTTMHEVETIIVAERI